MMKIQKVNLPRRYALVVFLVISLITMLLQGCTAYPPTTIHKPPASSGTSLPAQADSMNSTSNETSVKFVAAGDNILHEAVYNDAHKSDGSYDFAPFYENIAAEIHTADFAFINQEGPLGGTSLGLQGYPLFNAPQEAGTALVQTGFNLISQANNHAMDFGFKAISNTADYWKGQSGVVMSGMYANAEDYNAIPILTKKGLRIALIAYTDGLNGISKPADKPWCVDNNWSDVLEKVQKARNMADIVLVSAHWGTEYQNQPNSDQKSKAKQLADAGADIIIGNHPHVIQSPAWIAAADGRQVLCAYAMGNFLSSQSSFGNVVGGLLELTIHKSDAGITIRDVRFVPVVTHYIRGFKAFKIYLLSDYTESLAAVHGISDTADMSPAHIRQYVSSIVNQEFYPTQ